MLRLKLIHVSKRAPSCEHFGGKTSRVYVRQSLCPYDIGCPRYNSGNIFQIFFGTWLEYSLPGKYFGRLRALVSQLIKYARNWPKLILTFYAFLESFYKLDPWNLIQLDLSLGWSIYLKGFYRISIVPIFIKIEMDITLLLRQKKTFLVGGWWWWWWWRSDGSSGSIRDTHLECEIWRTRPSYFRGQIRTVLVGESCHGGHSPPIYLSFGAINWFRRLMNL